MDTCMNTYFHRTIHPYIHPSIHASMHTYMHTYHRERERPCCELVFCLVHLADPERHVQPLQLSLKHRTPNLETPKP